MEWHEVCTLLQGPVGEAVVFAKWNLSSRRQKPRSLYGNLIAYMENRLEEQPSDLRLRLSLVSHLEKAGRYEEAIHQIQRVLQFSPGDRRAKGTLLKLRLERRLSAIQNARI